MDNANTSSYRAGPHPRPLARCEGRGAPPGCLWGWRGEGQLLAAPQRLQRIEMPPGRFGAAGLQITDQLGHTARELQRQPKRIGVAHNWPKVFADLGAAPPHHQVAPDPAALLLIAPPPRDQRVERLLDRRPI